MENLVVTEVEAKIAVLEETLAMGSCSFESDLLELRKDVTFSRILCVECDSEHLWRRLQWSAAARVGQHQA